MKIRLKKENLKLPNISLFLNEEFNSKSYVNFSKFILKENSVTPWDQHKVSELWLILDGTGEIEINEDKHLLKKGDTYFIQPYFKHRIRNLLAIDLIIFSIWWENNEI